MTDEIFEAQENIMWITKHKKTIIPSKDLDLGLEWV